MPVIEADSPLRARGNSNDTVRQHNLSIILRLVHSSGGLARSELTAQTGLNRSTIAALVGELVERDLVVEAEPDARNRVGRPSPIVQPGPRPVAIAMNPEIDAITIAVVGFGGRVIERERHDLSGTPTAAETIALVGRAVGHLRSRLEPDHRVVGVGVAVPGLVREKDGLVRLAPHLGWTDEPIVDELSLVTGLSVVAANDARLGCLAESEFGSARAVEDVIYLFGGASGIGGGVRTKGTQLTGVDGYGGEFGHTLVNSAGELCNCGAFGCLETEARRASLLALVGLTDSRADELEAALIATNSPAVTAEVHRQLDFLAVALRNAINVLNPTLIVLGGFLGSLYATAPDYLNGLVASQALSASRETVRVTRAELGANILMIGAAELAFEPILVDPASF